MDTAINNTQSLSTSDLIDAIESAERERWSAKDVRVCYPREEELLSLDFGADVVMSAKYGTGRYQLMVDGKCVTTISRVRRYSQEWVESQGQAQWVGINPVDGERIYSKTRARIVEYLVVEIERAVNDYRVWR